MSNVTVQEALKAAKVKLLEANRNGYANGNDALALINEALSEIEKCEPVADIEELERALCVIRVVGNIDGHDVIRRESVINVARSRINKSANGEQK